MIPSEFDNPLMVVSALQFSLHITAPFRKWKFAEMQFKI